MQAPQATVLTFEWVGESMQTCLTRRDDLSVDSGIRNLGGPQRVPAAYYSICVLCCHVSQYGNFVVAYNYFALTTAKTACGHCLTLQAQKSRRSGRRSPQQEGTQSQPQASYPTPSWIGQHAPACITHGSSRRRRWATATAGRHPPCPDCQLSC